MADTYSDLERRRREQLFQSPASGPADPEGGPSIARLLGDLVGDAQTLMRKEVELARTEVLSEVTKVRDGATKLGLGAGVTAAGGLLLLLMVVALLVEVVGLSFWLSLLIVGLPLAIVGAVLLMNGLNQIKHVDPVPRETIDSVRKDVEWLKEQNPSDKI